MKKSLFWRAATALVACLIVSAPSLADVYVSPEEMDAQTVYRFSCAACHGVDGGGLSPDNPLYQSFDSPPADFTDALFNSREPAADWAIVIKHGGARIGLSEEMPPFAESFSDEQIEALVDYMKTSLVDASRYPPGDLNFVRAIDTIKAFPKTKHW